MKKILTVLAVIAIFTNFAFAGGDALTSAGDKALLFQFNGLANLGTGSFMSSPNTSVGILDIPQFNAIGVKYYFSDGFAGRAALLLGYNSETEKAGTGGFTDRKESSMGLGLEFGIQSNIIKSGSFVGFIGATAGFAMVSGTLEPSTVSPPPTGVVTKYDASATMFGLGGIAGFEYFIYDRISLAAEYQFGLVLGGGTYELTRQAQPTTTFDLPSMMSLGFNTVSFKLAAYF